MQVCKKSSSGLSSGTLKKSSLWASRRSRAISVSYTHLDVYKRQAYAQPVHTFTVTLIRRRAHPVHGLGSVGFHADPVVEGAGKQRCV